MPRALALSAKPRNLVICRSRVPPGACPSCANERTILAPDCSRSDHVWPCRPAPRLPASLDVRVAVVVEVGDVDARRRRLGGRGREEGGGQGQRAEQSTGSVHHPPRNGVSGRKLERAAAPRALTYPAGHGHDLLRTGRPVARHRRRGGPPGGRPARLRRRPGGHHRLRHLRRLRAAARVDRGAARRRDRPGARHQRLDAGGRVPVPAARRRGRPRRRRVADLRPHAAEPAQPRRGRADGGARDRRDRRRRARVAARARACGPSSRT